MNENLQDFSQQQQTIDYKVILYKFIRFWYFFSITIFIALIVAFVVNKYTKPVYQVKSTVLIKDKSENKLNPQNIMGLGLFNSMQNLQNEIGILHSYSLSYRSVLKCGFEVAYFQEANFIPKELYQSSFFIVEFDTSFPQPINVRFTITILSGNEYRLYAKDENVSFFNYSTREAIAGLKKDIYINETLRFGQEIATDEFKFKLLLTANYHAEENINKSYFFVFRDYPGLVKEFKSFTLEPINREASVVELTLTGGNSNKIADFLNVLTNEYLNRGL